MADSPIPFWGFDLENSKYTASDCSLFKSVSRNFGVWGTLYISTPQVAAYRAKNNLGLATMPGTVVIDASRKRKEDVKQAAGKAGASVTMLGTELAEVKIKVSLWTPDQWNEMQEFIRSIFPTIKDQKAEAYDVSHPILQTLKVRSITFQNIIGPKLDAKGMMTVEFDCREYAPQDKKPQVKQVEKSKSQSDNTEFGFDDAYIDPNARTRTTVLEIAKRPPKTKK